MRYANVLKFVAEHPWAILPATLDVIVEVLTLRAEGRMFTDEEIQARIGAAAPTRSVARSVGTVAVLPLYGVIAPRMNAMTQMSGGTSVQAFIASLRQAIESPDVSAVVIHADTPGGSVFGIEEGAAAIRDARGPKPIIAVADSLAASAGYWLVSQADEIIASPSSQLGSIGVMAVHVDTSAAEEKAGIKTNIITTAKFKAEAAPGLPLSDEARQALQDMAGGYHRAFVADVARGRGVSRAAVESGFGEGRLMAAADAVRAGLADGVGTLDQVIARLAGGKKRVAMALAEAEPVPIAAALAANDDPARYRLALAEKGL
jgi:signal peptide peptidase SppA